MLMCYQLVPLIVKSMRCALFDIKLHFCIVCQSWLLADLGFACVHVCVSILSQLHKMLNWAHLVLCGLYLFYAKPSADWSCNFNPLCRPADSKSVHFCQVYEVLAMFLMWNLEVKNLEVKKPSEIYVHISFARSHTLENILLLVLFGSWQSNTLCKDRSPLLMDWHSEH